MDQIRFGSVGRLDQSIDERIGLEGKIIRWDSSIRLAEEDYPIACGLPATVPN